MKVAKMNQNPQLKISIQEHLEEFNISTKTPQILDKDNCKVNLEGFKSIQGSFFVDVDKEIKKIQCKYKENMPKCDFILWSKKYCVLIEAKSGKNIKSKVIGQFESTYNYLKKQNLIYNITCVFLLVGGKISGRFTRKKLKEYKFPQKRLNKIEHTESGKDIFKYLESKINN